MMLGEKFYKHTQEQRLDMIIVILLTSYLGMGGRLWLEWGEFSLVEHTNSIVLIGYPLIITMIISSMTYLLAKYMR